MDGRASKSAAGGLGSLQVRSRSLLPVVLACPFPKCVGFVGKRILRSLQALREGDPGTGCVLAHNMGLGKTFQAHRRPPLPSARFALSLSRSLSLCLSLSPSVATPVLSEMQEERYGERLLLPPTGCLAESDDALGGRQVITFLHTVLANIDDTPGQTELRRVLVLGPVNTLYNWKAELARWLPDDGALPNGR
jgi:hypothetical protein